MITAYVGTARYLRWADNTRMVYQCATDSMNNIPQVLNLEFFYFENGCLTKTSEPSGSIYLLIAGKEMDSYLSNNI